MFAEPDAANYRRRCSPLELLNLDYIQRLFNRLAATGVE
jgi:hypothetical protein